MTDILEKCICDEADCVCHSIGYEQVHGPLNIRVCQIMADVEILRKQLDELHAALLDVTIGRKMAQAYRKDIQEQLAEAQADVRTLTEALFWCSGSPDFAPEGVARTGWVKGPEVALARPGVKRLMEKV